MEAAALLEGVLAEEDPDERAVQELQNAADGRASQMRQAQGRVAECQQQIGLIFEEIEAHQTIDDDQARIMAIRAFEVRPVRWRYHVLHAATLRASRLWAVCAAALQHSRHGQHRWRERDLQRGAGI